VPGEALADIHTSIGDWGALEHAAWGGALPWRASVVDQPAALAGNGCFAPSEIKATYGTGCFVLVNAGKQPPTPPQGLLASVAWSDATTQTYAFDGGVFTAGVVMNWLVSIGLVGDVAETAALAESVPDTGGVRFVPAFAGLGAPWWDNRARGAFTGMTGGTTRAHLVRAALDSLAFRVRDILEAAWAAGQPRPAALRVDGGLTKNGYLMQRQADVLGIPVECGDSAEATARGAAALAAIGAHIMREADVRQLITTEMRYEPRMAVDQRDSEYAEWCGWLERVRTIYAP
jgi:glycerol kinase